MRDANRRRITKRVVDTLPQHSIAWDSEVRGFGVRRQNMKRVYVLKARVGGRQRWVTIGEHGAPWTVESARREAQRLWGDIRSGNDPAHRREAMRKRTTVADLCQRYLTDHAEEYKKPSSVRMDRRNIENHVGPFFGTHFVDEVTRSDVEAFLRAVRNGKTSPKRTTKPYRGGAKVTGGPGAANRCHSLLSKMFNLAEAWGMRAPGSNPARQIKRYPERKCERFLSLDELARLGQEIEKYVSREGNVYIAAALRLLVFTGARLSEILKLRWEDIDFEDSVLNLPDSKTGQKAIYLNAPALEVLAAIPRVSGNEFVIVGHKDGRHLVNLRKAWGKIRTEAGLSDVRIHDLRHSFASVAVSSGLSLPIIGKLLGHKKAATTERYVHLAADPVKAANDAVGKRLNEAMQPSKKDPARIVTIGT